MFNHYGHCILVRFNPKQAGGFGPSKSWGGGGNLPGYVIDIPHCGFSVKSLFYGLNWKFRSTVVPRTNNHSSMWDTFALRQLGRKPNFVLKIFWFWVGKFLKIWNYLHAQYAHQMKAENIPNANQGLKLQFEYIFG